MSTALIGLTDAQAQEAAQKYGPNVLPEGQRTTPLQMFVRQFNNILILLLIAGGIISFAIGEELDSTLIFIIVIINALFGFVQEFKADNAIRSLKSMTVTTVRVLRDGTEKLIDSASLVPGDIVKLEAGDKIPADATVVEAYTFEVNEASLTGESLPVRKRADDPDANSVYMGTVVTSGSGAIRLTHTGRHTRIGSMAHSLSQIESEDTPLMKKVNTLGKQLSTLAIAVTILIFFLGIAQQRDYIEMLLISISLAVAAVPEGLPAVITITLTIGLQRMARKKAILRKLGSIEALGNTTIIATDKTGTLTQNKMNVIKLWLNGKAMSVKDANSNRANKTLNMLTTCGIHCNNSALATNKDTSGTTIIGDQTEGSLLLFAHDIQVPISSVKNSASIVDEYSFDQEKKMMSVVVRANGRKGDITVYTKGAPERVLAASTHISSNGTIRALDKKARKTIENEIDKFAKDGLRVLALSYKSVKRPPSARSSAEKHLVFLGIVGIADPAREGLKSIVSLTKRAGIRTVMITGDNPLTASSVARYIGLLNDQDSIVTGKDIEKMSDAQLTSKLHEIRIYARTTPEDKHRIVRLFQKQGEVVAVTGDGVNDALALKQADIGVAMGITGSGVAKEVADMIITDDNYASIVHAVREGRIIFDNIVKSIVFLVSCNFGELLTILGAMLASAFSKTQIETPLLTAHILWINLVTDSLPALSLAFDPGAKDVMEKRDAEKSHTLINKRSLPFIFTVGIGSAVLTLAIYFAALSIGPVANARAMAFTTLVLIQLAVVFIVRKGETLLSNRVLIASVVFSLILQFIVITIPPFRHVFVK